MVSIIHYLDDFESQLGEGSGSRQFARGNACRARKFRARHGHVLGEPNFLALDTPVLGEPHFIALSCGLLAATGGLLVFVMNRHDTHRALSLFASLGWKTSTMETLGRNPQLS